MVLSSEGRPFAGAFLCPRGSRALPTRLCHAAITVRAASLVFLTITVGVFFTGCSSSDPEIAQLGIRLSASWNPADPDVVQESLTIELNVEDPDGTGELQSVYIELPDSMVAWTVPVDELRVLERSGRQWYVTPRLEFAGSRVFPRGDVRVTAIDYSGRDATRSTQLPLNLPVVGPDQVPVLSGSELFAVPQIERVSIGIARGDSLDFQDLDADEFPADLSQALSGLGLRPGGDASDDEPTVVWIVGEWNRFLWIESGPWPMANVE